MYILKNVCDKSDVVYDLKEVNEILKNKTNKKSSI